jgi:hypothetical protein
VVVLGGFAQGASATDLGFDFFNFGVRYLVHDRSSPHYDVQHGDPITFTFNTPATAFLLPCAVERFGAQVQVGSAGPAAVYDQVEVRFYDTHNREVSAHLDLRLCRPLLLASGTDTFGLTPVYRGKAHLLQPTELPADGPVRMELTVRGFTDEECRHEALDPDPADNTMHFWIQRACPLP